MPPLTAFLGIWKETPVNQCHLWLPSWGYGRRPPSINVTCDCLLEGMEEDINQPMSPVTAFLRVWKKTSFNQCHLWLPSWGYGRKRLSAWPPGILRGRVQCRQAGGWRGTQTLTQKEHNNDIQCDKQTLWNFVSRKGAQCVIDSNRLSTFLKIWLL